MNKKEKEEKQVSITHLRTALPPGSTIYTTVTHVSRSGMSRSIRCFTIENDEPFDISYRIARALGDRLDPKNGGIKIGGCGMDMGFAIVHNLSYAIHGMESEGEGKEASNQGHPFPPRPGHFRSGYSLNHKWL